ncbi:flagellar basal body P-ring formation chaperone FlgA [Paracoccus spongiarum]|uniref:Flagella basal body P-ring formation protein FlgA n=1 Tax=Paracoccus spongiarum TaxID=3064387 RepID=A0ABT9JBN5_9RHOB|nr:flagellar basal body P-ring formation chaperone FlgA [Paracoccus sp. 2205BS29-5]MDP5307130.1 flagellar basal body P-ring formation chaperone FlgA [Paracoccus sp. 2205BS29-5]
MIRPFLIAALALAAPAASQAAVLAAARTLPVGTVIAAGDLRAIDGDRPGLSDPAEAIGLQTRVTIYEGRPLHANLLQAPRLINRNQIVRLSFQHGPLRIDTQGRAMSDGAAGDVVRVMNLDSRSTVTARVLPDGSLLVAD